MEDIHKINKKDQTEQSRQEALLPLGTDDLPSSYARHCNIVNNNKNMNVCACREIAKNNFEIFHVSIEKVFVIIFVMLFQKPKSF